MTKTKNFIIESTACLAAIFFLGDFTMAWDAEKFIKPSAVELKKNLSSTQYDVTQRDGTEAPFKNEFFNNKEAGLYVDIISGEPLFSSADKFDSGTGWPSFTRAIHDQALVTREDNGFFSKRIEVRSRYADSHLGHVFDDGPAPTYKRYCINSAALRFIPVDKLKKEGYEEYLSQFRSDPNDGGNSKPLNGGTVNSKQTAKSTFEKALFAGGCFWCLQPPFDKLKNNGVIEVLVGYSGGESANPNYEKVSAGDSGHKEVIEVTFDQSKISYEKLLEVYWVNVDPFDIRGQFCDKGDQYKSAIYYTNETQKLLSEKSREEIKQKSKIKSNIVTDILPAKPFYAGEEYHQNYYIKNPLRYKYYRFSCNRDKRLKEIWGE